nr:MAG TPA: hypothetical protein [Caudoviricetes sp.]DAV46800.1 MAG TPA: hypothetical protein [Caudoviricetes sp.]
MGSPQSDLKKGFPKSAALWERWSAIKIFNFANSAHCVP